MSHLCINIPTYKSWEGTGAGLQMVQLTQDLYVHDTEVEQPVLGYIKKCISPTSAGFKTTLLTAVADSD